MRKILSTSETSFRSNISDSSDVLDVKRLIERYLDNPTTQYPTLAQLANLSGEDRREFLASI